jgi:hypothetical protein
MYDYYEVAFGCTEESYNLIVETQKSREYVEGRASAEAQELAKEHDSGLHYYRVAEFDPSELGDVDLVVEEW